MKKYLTVFLLAWQEALIYRAANILYLVFSFINMFLTIAIWYVAFQNPVLSSKIPYSTFLSYYILVMFFQQITQSFIGGVVSDRHIKRGEMSSILMKPVSYFSYIICSELPWRFIQFLFSIPVIFVMVFLFRVQIHLQPLWFLIALGMTPFAYLLSFCIQVCFGFFTFWFEDAIGLFNLLDILIILFAGTGIPIFLFPPVMKTLGALLPFQYMLYIPVVVALQKMSMWDTLKNFSILLLWLFIFSFLLRFMWKKGLQKYNGEGI